jgi:hypothetical protein
MGDESTSGREGGAGTVAFGQVLEHWEDVVDDMAATAATYRERGWEAVELHPGDVHPTAGGDSWGLDVVVPDDEFPTVEAAVEADDAAFDSSQVFRAAAGGVVFAVVAMEDTAREMAVLVPVYLGLDESADTRRRAREEGELPVRVRPLVEGPAVRFTLRDPDPLVADAQ